MQKKIIKKNTLDIEKSVMAKVKSGKINMKPRWLFVAGSVASITGLLAFSLTSVFLINLVSFAIRARGPMAGWKLNLMLNSFPTWIPILAIIGITGGIILLKKYDFSYKNNFLLIIVLFIASLLFAGILFDTLGINNVWSRGRMMRKIYENVQYNQNGFQGKNSVKGAFHKK